MDVYFNIQIISQLLISFSFSIILKEFPKESRVLIARGEEKRKKPYADNEAGANHKSRTKRQIDAGKETIFN